MFPPILGDLPFPRGKTASGGLITPTVNYRKEVCGKFYWSPDTVHSTDVPVVLLTVRNRTGGDITVARKFAELDITHAYGVANAVDTFPCDTAGGVCAALDDAYVVGGTIPENDLFYVVVYGFVSVLTDSAVNSLAAGGGVVSTNAGLIANKATGAAGEFIVGRLDYAASYSAATATRIFACLPSLAPPPAA